MQRFKFLLFAAGALLARYAKLLAAWLALFTVFRLILIVATWHLHGDATQGLLLGSFLHGFKFDLSVGMQVAAPFALWRVWRPVPGLVERRIFLGLFSVAALVCIFTMTAEVEYYKEFQVRLGPLALEYFGKPEHNRIVLGMIWHGYPVVRWMLVCFAVWGLFVWITHKWVFRPEPSPDWRARMIATVLLIVFTVVGARGGLRGSPLRWGDSIFSHNTYANHVAQNGVFAMWDAVRQRKSTPSKWAKAMPLEEAAKITQELTLLPGETLVDATTYPLLRRSPAAELSLKHRPKNVVVVLMESFTARFCGATGAGFGATPNYDELAGGGILFDRAFSVSTHTAPGVFGSLCSFPNLPTYDNIMKLPLGNQPFRSLPQVLKDSGFSTLFLYNGLFSWDNKEGFMRQQGVERFIGRADYVNPVFVDPDWGVSDLDVFRRANEEFSALAKTGKPFLGLVLTLSNHAPFNLPKVEGLEWLTAGGDENQRLNGVHYADWAVGQFMAEARKQAWFNDTLFVFTGDHGFGIPPLVTDAALLHQHVPILFYGPEIFGDRHEVRHQVISQLDILPTIVGLLGLDVPHQAFGRDVFSIPADDPGHAYVKASGSSVVGWIEGNQIAISTPGKPVTLQTYDLSFPPGQSEDLAAQKPNDLKRMEQHMRGFVVTALHTLEGQRCAPPKRAEAIAH